MCNVSTSKKCIAFWKQMSWNKTPEVACKDSVSLSPKHDKTSIGEENTRTKYDDITWETGDNTRMDT